MTTERAPVVSAETPDQRLHQDLLAQAPGAVEALLRLEEAADDGGLNLGRRVEDDDQLAHTATIRSMTIGSSILIRIIVMSSC